MCAGTSGFTRGDSCTAADMVFLFQKEIFPKVLAFLWCVFPRYISTCKKEKRLLNTNRSAIQKEWDSSCSVIVTNSKPTSWVWAIKGSPWGIAYLKINLNEQKEGRFGWRKQKWGMNVWSRFFRMQSYKKTVQSIRMLFQGAMTFFYDRGIASP